MIEIIGERQENSKTFRVDSKTRQLVVSIGAIHYKDNYANVQEKWKDIDLTWVGNRITKAPYGLTHEDRKLIIRDKKSGEVSTIELLEIGGVPLPAQAWARWKGLAKAFDTDLEIVPEFSRVKFTRILKSDKAPLEAKFRVTGKIPFIVRASDEEGDLSVESTVKDGILTEILKPDRAIKYPVRLDPTWQVDASNNDTRRVLQPDSWLLSAVQLQVGYHDTTPNYMMGVGMRFTNITIPNSATIVTAKLIIVSRGNYAQPDTNTRISAEDVDDAVVIANNAAAFDARWANRTAARVNWDNIGTWVINGEYDSPEIKTVIQEIVSRGGWASGQSILTFWEDFEDRSSHAGGIHHARDGKSYDTSSITAEKLVVTYTLLDPVTDGDLIGIGIIRKS